MMHFAMDCIRCKYHMLDDDDDRNDALTIITHYYQFADGDDNIEFFFFNINPPVFHALQFVQCRVATSD